jgi:acyl carrier protein
MTTDDVRAALADLIDLIEAPGVPGASDDAPLDVDSLTLVSIVEALEDRFEIRISPREVVPANFASIAAIAAFIERKRA